MYSKSEGEVLNSLCIVPVDKHGGHLAAGEDFQVPPHRVQGGGSSVHLVLRLRQSFAELAGRWRGCERGAAAKRAGAEPPRVCQDVRQV